MSTVPAVSAVSSAVAFSLTADQNETVSAAAEMATDAQFDSFKAVQMIGSIFKPLHDVVVARNDKGEVIETMLTYEAWEVVRVAFERVATVRSRDNGAANPEGAANDVWTRVTKSLADFPYNLKKPKKKGGDAERVRVQREKDDAKIAEIAAGRSAQELIEAQMALFAQCNPQAIAEARALDKVIKAVEKIEKDTVDAQFKPLLIAANDNFKAAIDHIKVTRDSNKLMDLVVAIGAFVPAKQ